MKVVKERSAMKQEAPTLQGRGSSLILMARTTRGNLNMSEHMDSAIVKLWKTQEKKGGINVSPLESGTLLIVETQNSFYEFVIIAGKECTVFGGTRRDGLTRFPKPVKAVIHGSTWNGSILKVDWIGEGMRLEFHTEKGRINTSPVKNLTIEAPDKSWYYFMDWERD
jgi:hypothetical protein